MMLLVAVIVLGRLVFVLILICVNTDNEQNARENQTNCEFLVFKSHFAENFYLNFSSFSRHNLLLLVFLLKINKFSSVG